MVDSVASRSLASTAQQVFIDFRIATMVADSKTPYGQLLNHWMGVRDGKIIWIEPQPTELPTWQHVEWIQGNQRWLTPGLIDCHTHLVYGGNRADEWERRLNGESYQSIARSGGGIASTVRATRAATEDILFDTAAVRLESMIREGVTTVEIKSGYGLDLETELKMLRVARRLAEWSGVDVEATLLAAHAVPPEFAGRADQYLDLVCHTILPASKPWCTAVDIFCESIAFSLEQAETLFKAAINHGLNVKIHAEQLSYLGSAALAARYGALSADHLEYLTDADCRILKEHRTVATLLPGAFYFLKETQKPPVQSLLDHQVSIAIATDCNPGSSPISSPRTAGNMACTLFGLTPEQALAGLTRNAATALGLEHRCGTIEVGKDADFAVWQVDSPAEILYTIGNSTCESSYKKGRKLFCRPEGHQHPNHGTTGLSTKTGG